MEHGLEAGSALGDCLLGRLRRRSGCQQSGWAERVLGRAHRRTPGSTESSGDVERQFDDRAKSSDFSDPGSQQLRNPNFAPVRRGPGAALGAQLGQAGAEKFGIRTRRQARFRTRRRACCACGPGDASARRPRQLPERASAYPSIPRSLLSTVGRRMSAVKGKSNKRVIYQSVRGEPSPGQTRSKGKKPSIQGFWHVAD